MILDPGERDLRRKTDALDAELDALVAREVDALTVRRNAIPGVKRRVADTDVTVDASNPSAFEPEADGAARSIRSSTPPRLATVKSQDSNVIGIHSSAAANGVLFSAEEEAFIKQSVAFLRGRENADVLIEEVWALTVLDHHYSPVDVAANEPLLPGELRELSPDALSGEPLPRHAGNRPTVHDHRQLTSIQSEHGDRPAADVAARNEATAPGSTPPVQPRRSKSKSTGDSNTDSEIE